VPPDGDHCANVGQRKWLSAAATLPQRESQAGESNPARIRTLEHGLKGH